MASTIECVPFGDGVRIVRLVSTDRDIVVPDEQDGRRVVSIGDRFLMGSPNTDSRTLVIPASVTDMSRDALSGIIGIRMIVYGGDLGTFCSFGIDADYDCELVCRHDGREFRFGFLSGYPMSFPGFDDEVLKTSFRLSDEVAMSRLRDPVLLSESNRDRYARLMRDKIIPMAEHAVSSNDPAMLSSVVETGMLSRDDLRALMSRSVLSGKTAMTSTIMSILYRQRV